MKSFSRFRSRYKTSFTRTRFDVLIMHHIADRWSVSTYTHTRRRHIEAYYCRYYYCPRYLCRFYTSLNANQHFIPTRLPSVREPSAGNRLELTIFIDLRLLGVLPICEIAAGLEQTHLIRRARPQIGRSPERSLPRSLP